MLYLVSASTHKKYFLVAIFLSVTALFQQTAIAADQCSSSSNNTTANAALSIGAQGAGVAIQLINAILITEGQIGVMADRIIYTEYRLAPWLIALSMSPNFPKQILSSPSILFPI